MLYLVNVFFKNNDANVHLLKLYALEKVKVELWVSY